MGTIDRTWDNKGGLTTQQVADLTGLTFQGVRWLEINAIRKLWRMSVSDTLQRACSSRPSDATWTSLYRPRTTLDGTYKGKWS